MELRSLPGCGPASIVVGWVLEALRAHKCFDTVAIPDLPENTIYVPERRTMLCATAAAAPSFTASMAAAAAQGVDVILLRVGNVEEESVQVSVDLTLGSLPCKVWEDRALALYRDAHSAWLVPEGFGPAVSLGVNGPNLEIVPPYGSLAERAAGIARAERELARLLQPVEVR